MLAAAALLLSMCALAGEEPFAGRTLVVMIEERAFESWDELEELARAFEREHPGLAVKVIEQSGAVGQQDKSRFFLSGNLQLDVTRIDVTEFWAFHQAGALVDIQPFLDADPGFRESDYLPVLDGFRAADGHLFGLPSTFTPYVMYYNRDLLERAGLAPPRADWTWDDLLASARAATRDSDGDGRTDEWGISLALWLQAIVPWIWQNDGDVLDESLQHSRLAEPQAIAAVEFLYGLLHTEKVASLDATFENQFSQGLFQAGRAAFYGPVGYWETYRFKYVSGFRWDVAPLPRKVRAATAIAMTGYVVPRTAREPELAARFVQRLAGPYYQRTLAAIGNGVPALRSAAESPSFLDPARAPDSERVFLDVLPTARFMPALANWRKLEAVCQADLQGALILGDLAPRAACERMAAKIDATLARERERAARPRLWPGLLAGTFAAGVLAAFAALAWARARSRERVYAREERAAWILLLPWALGFAAFFLGPAAQALALAASDWSPLEALADARFAGLDNLRRLAADETFHASLGATAQYAAASVPLSLALSLALAWLLRGESALATFARTLIYVPAIVSPVIVAATWRFLLDPDRGLANELLAHLGIEGPAWTRSGAWVIPSFVLMSLWGVGAQMLVFLAAMKALDPSLEDAARVDGARGWRRFCHVVLPQLSPVVLLNLVIGVIAAFQIFAQAYVMTGGGPGDASRFLVLYLYETGFRHLEMGYASAIAWALFLVLAALCALLIASSRRWVHYAGRRPA